MVRYKKRYFVVEFERAGWVARGQPGLDLKPLDSRDVDIAEAVKEKVTELHGDFGRASMTVGFKVIYANRATRLVIMRARHGPHTLVAAALPLVTSIRREAVVGRLLYTGATVRHCHIAMLKRQKKQLSLATAELGPDRAAQLEAQLMQIHTIDAF